MKYQVLTCAIITLLSSQAHAIAVGEYNPSQPKVKVCSPVNSKGVETCTMQTPTPAPTPTLPLNLSPNERAYVLDRLTKEGSSSPTVPIKITIPGRKDPVIIDPVSTAPVGKVPLPAPLPTPITVKTPPATTTPIKLNDVVHAPIKVGPGQSPEPIKVGPIQSTDPIKVAQPIKVAPPVKIDPIQTGPVKLPVKVDPILVAQPVPTAPTSKAPVATTINGRSSTGNGSVVDTAAVQREKLAAAINTLDSNYIQNTYALANQTYRTDLSTKERAALQAKVASANAEYVKMRTMYTEQIKAYQTPAQKNVTDLVQVAAIAKTKDVAVSTLINEKQEQLLGQIRSGNSNALQTAKEMIPALQQAITQARTDSAVKAQNGGVKNVDQTKQVALEYALSKLQTEVRQANTRKAGIIDMPISLTPETR